ncbi:hypothetical protein TRAPUB_473 [Trametes pubescens]|uniref:Uncharacterized protein n=1 Tax=Trametes pubescens TaxID=154538 RepID=A0A1M2VLZ4_TRAPU|nr:hypothetical protein TRAPUB_473 [Trametes pubescens]
MPPPPKTPSRHRSRSETKTPLTASMFGVNATADASNPFIVPSRPASPIKRATSSSLQVSESLQRQASSGLIRKGGVESRLDVVTRDYVPPKSEKRSRSQPTKSCEVSVEGIGTDRSKSISLNGLAAITRAAICERIASLICSLDDHENGVNT